jgi:RNA polymerase sigma-70 factor (ECF subfamily)
MVAPKVPSRKGHPTNEDLFAGTPRKLDETPRQPVTRPGQELKPDARRTSTPTSHPEGSRGLSGARASGEERPLEIDWSQVVRRCMDGDSGAWAELVRSHHRRVYALCYRFTGNGADAEDLTQDVFLKIYSNLSSFDTARGSLQVWITTMTRNLLVDNFRRTRNQRATDSLDAGWDETDELRPVDRLQASGPSPHEKAAQKELARMVQDALAKVSVELREAVILRDLQDMDYKEIAQVLGIPEGTVKSRISRGRAELARLLERNKREVM